MLQLLLVTTGTSAVQTRITCAEFRAVVKKTNARTRTSVVVDERGGVTRGLRSSTAYCFQQYCERKSYRLLPPLLRVLISSLHNRNFFLHGKNAGTYILTREFAAYKRIRGCFRQDYGIGNLLSNRHLHTNRTYMLNGARG